MPRVFHPLTHASGTPLRVVVFGVQASGKGTQAELIAQKFRLSHVSTGNIFRHEIARGTVLGRRVQRKLGTGKLVPDAVTNALVTQYLGSPVARRGYVLDGYPRNRAQLKALERRFPATHAIEIRLPDRAAVSRIAGRLNCDRCGLSYHVKYHPPKRDARCDRCGQKLSVRDDDRPAAIHNRLRIYHRQTAPLLSYYRKRGVLFVVDGRPAIPQVFAQVRSVLQRAPRA